MTIEPIELSETSPVIHPSFEPKVISPLDEKVQTAVQGIDLSKTVASKPLLRQIENIQIVESSEPADLQPLIDQVETMQRTLSSSNETLSAESFDRIVPKDVFNEVLKWSSKQENKIHGKINELLVEGHKMRGQIHTLLKLSNAFTRLPNNATHLSEEAKTLLTDLKKDGINLWDDLNGPISREKIIELKSEASAQVDRVRSEVNNLLVTKVNYFTQTLLPALLEMMKKAAAEQKEGISRMNERMSR